MDRHGEALQTQSLVGRILSCLASRVHRDNDLFIALIHLRRAGAVLFLGEAGLVLKHPSFCVDVVQLDYPQPARRVGFRPRP